MTAVEARPPGDREGEPPSAAVIRGVPSQTDGLAELLWPADAPVLDALDAAVIVTDRTGVVLYANPAAERLYGHPRAALLDSNVQAVLVADGDEQRAGDIMARVLAGESWSGEFDVPHADGRLRTVRITDSPVYRDGEVVAIVGLAEDVTRSRQVGRDADRFGTRLAQLAHVTASLAAAQDVATAVTAVVVEAGSAVEAQVTSLSLLSDTGVLVLAGIHGAAPEMQQQWASYPLNAQLPASEAVRTGRPVVVPSREIMEERYPALSGLIPQDRSMVCLPLTVLDHRLGVLSLSFTDGRLPDQAEMTFLAALADICAQTLQRLAALDDARAAADKLLFLAEASVQLAGSLDLDRTLTNVARLVVPRLADWCVVHVAEQDQYRSVAVTHADPNMIEWAHALQDRYPVDPQATTGVPAVIATGQSELHSDITEELLVAGAVDDEHLRILRQLGMRSAVIVPLTGRTGTFGAITMIVAESGRRFDQDDLQLAEDLARRAALAVEAADAFWGSTPSFLGG